MCTKGEWKVEKPANAGIKSRIIVGGDKQYTIATVNDEANVYLIAAAPDLYEACKQALRTFEAHRIKPTDPRYLILQQAIAKVKEV